MAMPARDNTYWVHVKGRHRVEYKDRDRTVVFDAAMLDRAVYLGGEKVSAGWLDPGQREEVIERVHYQLNVVRQMGLEFINPDDSRWRPRTGPSGETARLEQKLDHSAGPGPLTRLFRRITGSGREPPS
jgi:hypothetical protein